VQLAPKVAEVNDFEQRAIFEIQAAKARLADHKVARLRQTNGCARAVVKRHKRVLVIKVEARRLAIQVLHVH
jgi:hypothetical protein